MLPVEDEEVMEGEDEDDEYDAREEDGEKGLLYGGGGKEKGYGAIAIRKENCQPMCRAAE